MVLARPRNFSAHVKMAMYKYQLQWCVRGYHIYKEEWEAAVGEELKCEREKNNAKDPYAVAVVRENVIVGHLPRKISQISALFLKRQGKISWKVLGTGVLADIGSNTGAVPLVRPLFPPCTAGSFLNLPVPFGYSL